MRRERGFTLVEVLLVTAMLGLLALLALPKVQGMKVRAQTAVLQSDLHALMNAQQLYHIEHMRYADAVEDLHFVSSPKVEIELRSGSEGAGARDRGRGPPEDRGRGRGRGRGDRDDDDDDDEDEEDEGSSGGGEGWTGRATYAGVGVACAVFVGDISDPFDPAREEGVIACDAGEALDEGPGEEPGRPPEGHGRR